MTLLGVNTKVLVMTVFDSYLVSLITELKLRLITIDIGHLLGV